METVVTAASEVATADVDTATLALRKSLKKKLNLAMSIAKVTDQTEGLKLLGLYTDYLVRSVVFHRLSRGGRCQTLLDLTVASSFFMDHKMPAATRYAEAFLKCIQYEESVGGYPIEKLSTEVFMQHLDLFIAFMRTRASAMRLASIVVSQIERMVADASGTVGNAIVDIYKKSPITWLVQTTTSSRSIDNDIYFLGKVSDLITNIRNDTSRIARTSDAVLLQRFNAAVANEAKALA